MIETNMNLASKLTERDIEDWIYEKPGALGLYIEGWIGRQYRLNSGIADLIGYTGAKYAVVIELKNVPIDKAALAQVYRYGADIEEIAMWRKDYAGWGQATKPFVHKVIIGPSIDRQTLIEAAAMDIQVIIFTLSLDMTFTDMTRAANLQHQSSSEGIGDRQEWDVFGPSVFQEKGSVN